jgi:hypothetical protein
MSYNLSFDQSNKADFVVDLSATDAETGDDIDFTGASVSIAIWEENCSPIITASIGSGITQPTSTVLELTITAAQMGALRRGTYRIGGIYTIAGETTQLFRGDFVVYDGLGVL